MARLVANPFYSLTLTDDPRAAAVHQRLLECIGGALNPIVGARSGRPSTRGEASEQRQRRRNGNNNNGSRRDQRSLGRRREGSNDEAQEPKRQQWLMQMV